MLGTDLFSRLLDERYKSIQDKVEKEKNLSCLTNDDTNIIIMKGLDNHINHLEIDMKNEFQEIRKEFKKIDTKFEKVENEIKEMRKDLNANNKWLITSMFVITGIIIGVIKYL